jgi:tRNA-dihydrouridine synthase B
MFRHLELQISHSGEERGIKEMRKHLAWYLRGMPGAAKIKEKINHLTSFNAVREALLEYAAGLEPLGPVNR